MRATKKKQWTRRDLPRSKLCGRLRTAWRFHPKRSSSGPPRRYHPGVRRVVVFALFVAMLLASGSAAVAEATQVSKLDHAHTDLEVFMEVRATSRSFVC